MSIFKANKGKENNNSQNNDSQNNNSQNNNSQNSSSAEATFEPGKVDEILNGLKGVTESMATLSTRMDGLETGQKELRESTVMQTNYNKIYTSAKSFGASHEEADILAKDTDKSHEEKLEECLSNALTFKSNAKKAFSGTKPSGSLDTNELLDADKKGQPKNRSEAVVKVKKDTDLKGREAVDKAEELYPEACNRKKSLFQAAEIKTFS